MSAGTRGLASGEKGTRFDSGAAYPAAVSENEIHHEHWSHGGWEAVDSRNGGGRAAVLVSPKTCPRRPSPVASGSFALEASGRAAGGHGDSRLSALPLFPPTLFLSQ